MALFVDGSLTLWKHIKVKEIKKTVRFVGTLIINWQKDS